MPREMHSFDGTRWTSTSSAATLKAPHGGSMGALEAFTCDCAGMCKRCGGGMQGLGGCGCGTSARYAGRRFALRGLEGNIGSKTNVIPGQLDVGGMDASFLGARIEPVQAGQKQGVQAEIYVFGQPPLDTRGTLERARQAMLELGMQDAKISASTFPLAWSWAYDSKDKSWTAYVSNADAGPFARLLDRTRSYAVQYETPIADDIKNLPTTGAVVQVLGEFPRAMTVEERTRVIRTFKPFRPLGTDLFFALRFYNVPAVSRGWLWGIAALGGLAYMRSRM
jgi:hypothetical protein